ncbi:MAG: WG repeat-containing protein [Ruminococcus sp.]|nr:WG repeat-containing protein [Ruminococcus sp.]
MNKHTRLLVVVLFVILILLASAITMFYLDVNKDTHGGNTEPARTELSGSNAASHVFQDENGRYGLTDDNGNIILEAEWTELSGIGNRCFAAKLVTNAKTLTGIIDNEGNVVVPFAYKSMERLTDFLYAGQLEADGKYFFYDADFQLLLPDAWDSYSLVDETLRLEKDGDTFIYGLGAELSLIEIDLPRRIRPVSFTLQTRDAQVLRKAERSDWCEVADCMLAYLDAYRREKPERLAEFTTAARLLTITEASDTAFRWKGGALDSVAISAAEVDGVTMLQCETKLAVQERETESETGAGTSEEMQRSADLKLTFAADESGDWYLYHAEFSEPSDSGWENNE